MAHRQLLQAELNELQPGSSIQFMVYDIRGGQHLRNGLFQTLAGQDVHIKVTDPIDAVNGFPTGATTIPANRLVRPVLSGS